MLTRVCSLLLGRRVSMDDPSSSELLEKLADSLNTIFNTLNQLISVINMTFTGEGPPEQTIRQVIGPPTRFGIAKGMWQFIPSTVEKYGLRIGPPKDEAVLDLLDERHNFDKSTRAAASYLRDIYTTDAQASGLLVMVS